MKKLLFSLFLALVGLVTTLSVQAFAYPATLNCDSKWVLVDGHMDMGQYLNVKSIRLVYENPIKKCLEAEVIYDHFTPDFETDTYKDEYTIEERGKITVLYDVKNRTAIVDNEADRTLSDIDHQVGATTTDRAGIAQRMYWEYFGKIFFPTKYERGGVPAP